MMWLRMNAGNILVLFVLAVIVAGIVYKMIQGKRKGKSGCAGCSGCSGCCGRNCGPRKE